MPFEKGQSGNPAGRPKGIQDKRTALRELLEPHAEQLVEKAKELALNGDTTALRLCLERIIPPVKTRDEPVSIPELEKAEGLTAKGEALLIAVARGDLGPDQASALLSVLVGQARVSEVDALEKRITALEKHNGR